MSEKSKRSESILKTLVVVLVVAVLAQTYYMYQYMNKPPANNSNKTLLKSTKPAAISCPLTLSAPSSNGNRMLPPAPSVNPRSQGPSQQQLASAMQQLSSTRRLSAQQSGRHHGMAGFGNDPFEEMERIHQMMNAMMSNMGAGQSLRGTMPGRRLGGSSSMPSVKTDQNNYVVTMKMPGLNKSEIKTEVNGNMLTITGIQRATKQSGQGQQLFAQSSSYSQFSNSLSLPGPVISDKMTVDYNNDVLTITIPKA